MRFTSAFSLLRISPPRSSSIFHLLRPPSASVFPLPHLSFAPSSILVRPLFCVRPLRFSSVLALRFVLASLLRVCPLYSIFCACHLRPYSVLFFRAHSPRMLSSAIPGLIGFTSFDGLLCILCNIIFVKTREKKNFLLTLSPNKRRLGQETGKVLCRGIRETCITKLFYKLNKAYCL